MSVREQAHQLVLHPVRVLILVDEDVAEFALIVVPHLRLIFQQAHGAEDKVVEIERVRLTEHTVVARIDLGDALAFPVAAARPLPGKLLRREQLVLRLGDHGKHVARRQRLFVQLHLLENVLHHTLAVVGVVDGEVPGKAELINVAAQDAHTGGVECQRPDLVRARDPEGRKALAQLLRGLVGKGHGKHLPRSWRLHRAETPHLPALVRGRLLRVTLQKGKVALRHVRGNLIAVAPAPVGQQVRDAVDEHRRLAAARAREQQQRPLGRQHAAALLGVQLCKIPRDARAPRRAVAGGKIIHAFHLFSLIFSVILPHLPASVNLFPRIFAKI